MNTAILGASWGDEGKAKIVHDLSVNYDWVIRFAGGDNCGGQVIRNGKSYIHHLLPAIDYTKSKAKSFLGAGMVINLESLLNEIKIMQEDFPNVGKSVVVDMDAFVIKQEYIEEDKLTGIKQGTTFRGIKQAYRAKIDRSGTRVYDLIRDKAIIIKALESEGVQFIPLLYLRKTMEKSNLLFEGNQGVMLSLDQGIYPYVTSSDTTVSGIYSSGFHWVKLNQVYGVAKGGYITRSGGKKMPTEMSEEDAKIIIEKANERGNTTGRNRDIGYFDCVALKYACKVGGLTKLVLTKLDIMNQQKTIKVCSSYGKEVYSPSDFIDNITPHYIDLPGWTNSKNIEETLPFIKYIQTYIGCPVEYISTGVNREDLIKL